MKEYITSVSYTHLIAPLHMHNFAENALTHHTQKGHFVAVIAAVFKKHAELAGLFGSPDELLSLIHISVTQVWQLAGDDAQNT